MAPPPYRQWPGTLNHAKCQAMLHDPSGVFRRMWATEGWGKMVAGSQTGTGSACWLHARDNKNRNRPAGQFWQETLEGRYCGENWYEGNGGLLGLRGRPPTYTAAAPALFGEDSDIGRYCANQLRQQGLPTSFDIGHAGNCVAANINILNIASRRVPYNLCRNLEWQVCAAQGRLPGQGSNTVLFATSPNSLDPKPSSSRPLGQCGGWKPDRPPPGGYGYANFDIFYLEACVFDQICTNGADIFNSHGGPFHCQFSEERFRELERVLSQPFVEPLEDKCDAPRKG